MKPILLATVAALALIGVYLAAGGATYGPAEVQDPCEPRVWNEPDGLDQLGQQLALSGIDGAACELGVTREALARALADDQSREEFAAEQGISDEEFENAVRSGLMRMIDDAEEAGEIGGIVALGLRALARVVPAQEAFDLLQDARPLIERGIGAGEGLGAFDENLDGGLSDGLSDGLDGLGEDLDQLDRGPRRFERDLNEAIDGAQSTVEEFLEQLER
ncbi:MAG TPA: hypothetical protein VFD37_00020 [Solirubrobacterales bacterium]|nr:hypothetical protein [Solirubrobacterales bacterium]